jgi:hypothetical protein
MKKSILISSMVLLGIGLFIAGWFAGPASAADKTTLNLVSFVPKMNISYRGWAPLFIDKVNKRSNGELFIKYRGGPEVIPPFVGFKDSKPQRCMKFEFKTL